MSNFGERRLIHHGKKFDLEMVSYTTAKGKQLEREMVRHGGAVCILPILEAAEGMMVVMIRNWRFTLGKEILELPAGTLDKGEDPAACAGRELIEETGYRAINLIPLGSFYTTPGMTDERMHAFAATGLTFVGQRLEEDEQIKVELVNVKTALARLDSAELVDAKSIVTLMLGHRKGLLDNGGATG